VWSIAPYLKMLPTAKTNSLRMQHLRLKMLNRLLPVLLRPFFGKPETQPFFENLRKLSLQGMQIGGGCNPENSGELTALQYIFQRLATGEAPLIMDVGAHKGEYAELLLQVFGKRCRVMAFEPAKDMYDILSNRLQHTTVTCLPIGFGSTAGTFPLYRNPQKPSLSSLYQRNLEHINLRLNNEETITLDTLDAFCAARNIGQIDFLKLDVEGHELEVLRGAGRLIEQGKIRFIQFEFGGCNIDARTFFADFFRLLESKYCLYRILEKGLYRISHYSELHECFTYTNFLAERKMP
jgi:FkbM family methyltransferase